MLEEEWLDTFSSTPPYLQCSGEVLVPADAMIQRLPIDCRVERTIPGRSILRLTLTWSRADLCDNPPRFSVRTTPTRGDTNVDVADYVPDSACELN